MNKKKLICLLRAIASFFLRFSSVEQMYLNGIYQRNNYMTLIKIQ